MHGVQTLFSSLIATPWFSYRERSGGVQQGANLAEQFIELEWLCQEFEAAQIVGSMPNRRQ